MDGQLDFDGELSARERPPVRLGGDEVILVAAAVAALLRVTLLVLGIGALPPAPAVAHGDRWVLRAARRARPSHLALRARRLRQARRHDIAITHHDHTHFVG
jgi:hypothetical protein